MSTDAETVDNKKDDINSLSDVDREALQRAIDLTLSDKDHGRREQVQSMLRERNWYEVASFCSYVRQIQSLGLKPWHMPVCWLDADQIADILSGGQPAGDIHGEYEAAKLGQRLLTLGKSLYEPNPVAALVEE